jgi:ferredoxin
MVKVSVNPMKCRGHARCWVIDEDLFTLDDEGNCDIGIDKIVPSGLESDARAAVLNCPENALTFVDESAPDNAAASRAVAGST